MGVYVPITFTNNTVSEDTIINVRFVKFSTPTTYLFNGEDDQNKEVGFVEPMSITIGDTFWLPDTFAGDRKAYIIARTICIR